MIGVSLRVAVKGVQLRHHPWLVVVEQGGAATQAHPRGSAHFLRRFEAGVDMSGDVAIVRQVVVGVVQQQVIDADALEIGKILPQLLGIVRRVVAVLDGPHSRLLEPMPLVMGGIPFLGIPPDGVPQADFRGIVGISCLRLILHESLSLWGYTRGTPAQL